MIWLPFWMNNEIVIDSLMSDEKIFVTELGSSESTVKNEVADVRFFATKFFWLIPGPDFVQRGVSWNFLKYRESRVVITSDWKGVPGE